MTQTPHTTRSAAEYAHALARAIWRAECIALAHIIGSEVQR